MNLSLFRNSCTVFLLAAIVSSCSMLDELGHKQFAFNKEGKERRLLFQLPKGKEQENFRVGENDAKEQFYYLGDGSVFYIARHTTWQTVNKHRIEGLEPRKQHQSSSFSGKDRDGLYWKEIQFEEFRIGYAYVPASRVERFDETLNSVKIR
ncbi:MAG: hypothetical protein WDO16_16870 [Bacteroidota bacterium]